MKKIGIVTRFNIYNHGSILQSLASQKLFEEFGYEAEIINYINQKEQYPNIVKESLKRNKDWNQGNVKKIIYYFVKYISMFLSDVRFKKYRSNMLNLSKKFNTLDDLLKEDFSDYILCSGSDQLWGPIIDGTLDPVYFLSFSDSPKFSFSSSVGRDLDFSEEYIHYLSKYSFISVREQTTKLYLDSLGMDNCIDIFDPTLLIEKDFWNSLVTKKIKNRNKDYILFYSLHKNNTFEEEVKLFSKKKKMKVIRITNCIEDIFLFGEAKVNISPAQFLYYIKNAKYIVTDSFHCTVFSIIFNKQFITLSPGLTSIRIRDLLTKLNLIDRIIDNTNCIYKVENDINYSFVNTNIEGFRKKYKKVILENLRDIK